MDRDCNYLATISIRLAVCDLSLSYVCVSPLDKNKRTSFFRREGWKKMGRKQGLYWIQKKNANTSAIFWKKTFHGKEHLCNVCVCKKWHCRFFEAFDLPKYESVRVWAFLACKNIEIRVMWTFTASKKENPCLFLRQSSRWVQRTPDRCDLPPIQLRPVILPREYLQHVCAPQAHRASRR